MRGKEKAGRGERSPERGQLLNDHGESGLGCGSQHIHLDLRQARDWFPLTAL